MRSRTCCLVITDLLPNDHGPAEARAPPRCRRTINTGVEHCMDQCLFISRIAGRITNAMRAVQVSPPESSTKKKLSFRVAVLATPRTRFWFRTIVPVDFSRSRSRSRSRPRSLSPSLSLSLSLSACTTAARATAPARTSDSPLAPQRYSYPRAVPPLLACSQSWYISSFNQRRRNAYISCCHQHTQYASK